MVEEKFGYFISEHHLAFALADHCSKLFPTLSDSEIARSFKCGRTKATGQEVMNDILTNINGSQFFSIQTDESRYFCVSNYTFLHEELHSFVKKLMLRFMLTNSVQGIDKIGDINLYCASNHKPLNAVRF